MTEAPNPTTVAAVATLLAAMTVTSRCMALIEIEETIRDYLVSEGWELPDADAFARDFCGEVWDLIPAAAPEQRQ